MQGSSISGKSAAVKNVPFRIFNALLNVLVALILLSALAVIFISIQSKVTGVTPSVGGYRILKVLSGSMEPAIHTGSVILIREADPEQLKVGDIITFKSEDYDGKLVTHRIIQVNDADKLSFITKGDANSTADASPVYVNDISGIMEITIPYMGILMNFIQSPAGLVSAVIVPGVIIMLYGFIQIITYVKKRLSYKSGT